MKQPPDMPEPIGAVCPYCKKTLDKTPKRRTKCPHCGEYIFVRSGQDLFASILLTEQDARVVDHFHRLEGIATFGVDRDDFFRERERLTRQFGKKPSSSDVLWSLYNTVISRLADIGEFHPSFLYFLMAHFLYDEGREFRHLLQQSIEMQLTEYRESRVADKVRILTGRDGSCEACRQLEGRVFTLDEAFELMPIPCKDCTFELHPGKPGWCRCQYLSGVD